jgi:hypothetical protein
MAVLCWSTMKYAAGSTGASGPGTSGTGTRLSADALLSAILHPCDADLDEPTDGDWWGVNAWRASDRDGPYREKAEADEQD